MHKKRLITMTAAVGSALALFAAGAADATVTSEESSPEYVFGSAPTYDAVAVDATFSPASQWTASTDTYPLKGDFDGNGLEDIFWYGPGTSADGLWLANPYFEGNVGGTANPTARFTTVAFSVGGSAYKPFSGDFDGDGYSDIFWYAPGDQPDSIWYFGADTDSPTSVATSVNGTYQPIVGDYDQNDGVPSEDIFWYGQNASESVWSGRSTRTFAVRTFGTQAPRGAQVLVGNFTADGARTGSVTHQRSYFPDLFFYTPGSGADALWSSRGDGNYDVVSKTVNGIYKPVVGTFHAGEAGWTGGLTDIFWYTPGTGTDTMWMSTGTGFNSSSVAVNGTYVPFTIPGMVGADTLVWNNPAGSDAVWSFSGAKGTLNKVNASFPGADMGTREPIVGYFDDYVDQYDFAYIGGTVESLPFEQQLLTSVIGSTTTTSTSTTISHRFDTSELPRADVLWWSTGNGTGDTEKIWRMAGSTATFDIEITTTVS